MSVGNRLLFGPLSAVLFLFGSIGVGLFLQGYSPVRQDVSEIGALGTPTQLAFAVLVLVVAACLAVFAWGVAGVAGRERLPRLAAHLIGFVVLSEVGIAIFATPHPLHEPFGLVSLIGYQAPAALAIGWRRKAGMRAIVAASWLFFVALWAATVLILGQGIWPPMGRFLEPVDGMVQRTLFLAWFGWCAVTGVQLWRAERTRRCLGFFPPSQGRRNPKLRRTFPDPTQAKQP